MIKAVYKSLLMIFLISLLTTMASPLVAQVYKVVDENGNVTYTDKPPPDGSKPVDLPPISVIEAPTYEKAPEATEDDGEEPKMSLGYMRRVYRDFAISSPGQEESVWKPDGPVAVTWTVRTALQPGMQVILYLDGRRHTATVQPMIPLTGLDRGEHTLKAELRDARNRIIATAETITFFVRQPNLYSNPGRRGG
jgi:hypothetical protein